MEVKRIFDMLAKKYKLKSTGLIEAGCGRSDVLRTAFSRLTKWLERMPDVRIRRARSLKTTELRSFRLWKRSARG